MVFVVREYIDDDGRIPFRAWLEELDTVTRARVQARVLYFGRKGRELVLLLTGGDKKSQKSDIKRAKALWADYLKEQKSG